MPTVCLCFNVHQPFQLKPFSSLDIDASQHYENTAADQAWINTLAANCYLPANKLMLSLIQEHRGRFKISYSISGTALELFQLYRPDVIASFRNLVNTGCVEILAETYYHSLSFLHSRNECERQILKHHNLVKKWLGVRTAVFHNTASVYNNELATFIAGLGFKGILCEGDPGSIQHRKINQVYAATGMGNNGPGFGLLLRNNALSDDIAFRFDDHSWSEHPLKADKFAGWIHAHAEDTDVINLVLDYETIGVHKKKETGIFDFLSALPAKVLAADSYSFRTPTEVLRACEPKHRYDVSQTVGREAASAGCCTASENVRQHNTLKKIYSLEKMVLNNGNTQVMDIWGRFQTSDYFRYTCLHPFATPEEAFQSYSNMVTDFEIRLIRSAIEKHKKHAVFRSVTAGLL
jgi:alpha-amylase